MVDVAVTLGSRADRRSPALEGVGGSLCLHRLSPDRRSAGPVCRGSTSRRANAIRQAGTRRVAAVAAVLVDQWPDVVFLPHAADWNATHVGVHHLVVEAMRRLPALACRVVETEYWGAMTAPNLMVESTAADVADLVAALSLHAGEVARNAYHLRLPAWMMDNVRRGTELIGGQGATAPRFVFATLYRLRGWKDGQFHDVLDKGRAIAADDSLEALIPIVERGGD